MPENILKEFAEWIYEVHDVVIEEEYIDEFMNSRYAEEEG